MHEIWTELRTSARTLLRSPGIGALVVLTLGFAIGANVAVFSIVDGVLLEPLSFPAPERLVLVSEENRAEGISGAPTSAANFLDWRRQALMFERIAIYRGDELTLTGGGEPTALPAARVSSELFPLLGVSPVAGRYFDATEDRAGGEAVAVLSRGLWQRRFGGDRGVIGRSLDLGGTRRRIVGVAPSLEFLHWAEVFVPAALGPEDTADRGARRFGVVARLRANATLAQATSEMELIARRLERTYADSNAGWRVQIVPLRDAVVGDVSRALLLLEGAVGLVLLIACANTGSLLLARALARQEEMAVRLALGASAGRIGRQLIVESLMLGLPSGLFGVVLAKAGTGLLGTALAAELPRAERVGLNGRVLAFAIVVSVLASLLFGLAPALQLRRTNLIAALRKKGDGAQDRRSRLLGRSALIVLEFALTTVLVAGAGLMSRSFVRLLAVDLGFEPRPVLAARISLPGARYPSPEQRLEMTQRVLERVRALPGVRTAAIASSLPVSGFNRVLAFRVQGVATSPGQEPSASSTSVSPGYFQVLGIPLKRGRTVLESDRPGSTPVAVINETLARRYWPGANPLGRQLTLSSEGEPREVIGVVGDVRSTALTAEPAPAIYLPYAQSPAASLALLVRGVQPASLAAPVREAILGIDPDQPIAALSPLSEMIDHSLQRPRLSLILLSSFALFGLALAALGLYGLMAYSVGRRRRELGVRIAMGAQARQILQLVSGYALALALPGVALGSFAALALGPLATSLLFQESPSDPLVFSAVSLLLLAVALAASFGPALRALRTDPSTALR